MLFFFFLVKPCPDHETGRFELEAQVRKCAHEGCEKLQSPYHRFPALSAHWSHLRGFKNTNARVPPQRRDLISLGPGRWP